MGACCGGASPPTAAELGGPHGTVLSMLYGEYQANEGSYASAWEVTLEGVRSAAAGALSGVDKDTGTRWRTFARRDLTHVNLYFGLSGTHYVLLATPKDDSAQIHTWCSLVEDYEFNTRASRQHFFDKMLLLQTVLDRCGAPDTTPVAGVAGGAGAKASVDDAKAASAAQHRGLLTWPRVEFIIASDGYFDQTRKFSSVWQSRASISSYNDLFSFFTELDGEMDHRKANPPPAAGTKGGGHKRYLSRSAAPKSALQLARV